VVAGLGRAGCASDRRQRRSEQAEIDRLRAENQRLTGKLAQTQAALSIMGSTRALGKSGRELGTTERVEQVMDETFAALTAAGLPVTAACRLIGRARASHYRHLHPPVQGPRPRREPEPAVPRIVAIPATAMTVYETARPTDPSRLRTRLNPAGRSRCPQIASISCHTANASSPTTVIQSSTTPKGCWAISANAPF